MTLLNYIRLDLNEKSKLLWKEGTIVDVHVDKDVVISLFYIYDFFVEVTVSINKREVIDIIPYKRGFSFSKAKQKQKELSEKKAECADFFREVIENSRG